MIRRSPRCLVATALALALAACGGPAKAPATPPPPPPPTGDAAVVAAAPATAESVLEAAIEATGGRTARAAVTSLRGAGTMKIAKLGIGGKLTMAMRVPNLTRLHMEIDGLGNTDSGSDGTVVWESSAMTGARILTGAERERTLRDSSLNSDLNWRELYPKVELAGEADYEGRPAWKILLTDPAGDTETKYFDRETHFELGSEKVAKTQMGDLPTRTRVVSWQTYGAIKMPDKIVESTQGMDIEITMDRVELNPTLPADAFVIPPAVAALLKK